VSGFWRSVSLSWDTGSDQKQVGCATCAVRMDYDLARPAIVANTTAFETVPFRVELSIL
jgi:hypothetical protein